MYPKISFNENKNYFKESEIFQELKDKITPNYPADTNLEVVNLSVQLFMESVIKHNLDFNMLSVEQLRLLSDDNSKEVLKVFGKIMYKSKDKRTQEDFQKLRLQGNVVNRIVLYLYDEADKERNVCEAMKQEFDSYTTQKDNKPIRVIK